MQNDPKAKIVTAISFYDLDLLLVLLGPVPFAHAHPIYNLIADKAAQQMASGMLELVQAAADTHCERQALLSLSVSSHDVN